MNDWRQSLEWIVLVVFIFLLVFTFLIGILSGLKRTLYWTVANIVFWLLAMIFTLTLSGPLANTFSNIIGKNNPDLQKSAYDIIYAFAGLIFFLICTILGNILLAIPLYFGLFKRLFKIGPKNNKGAKLTIKSRFAAAPISLILFFPQTLLLTQATIAGTTHFTNQKNGIQQAAYNIYKITNTLNSYINFYVGDMYDNVNTIYNLLDIVNGNTINEMSDNINTFVNSLQTEFKTLDPSKEDFTFTKVTADEVNTVLNSYQSVTNPSAFGNQLDEIFSNKLGIKLINDNLDKFTFDAGISKADYEQMAPFIQPFHDGYNVNTYEATPLPSKIDVALIKMSQETENKKIPINYNTFIQITDMLKYKIFKKDEWQDSTTCLYATQLLLGSFIFNVNKESLINSDPDNFKNIKLIPIIDVDKIILSKFDNLINENNKEKFQNADGTSENPYIIPINLFFFWNSSSELYQINDATPATKLPITFYLKNDKDEYPVYQNLKYESSSNQEGGSTDYMKNYIQWSSNTDNSLNIDILRKDTNWNSAEAKYFHDGNSEKYQISFTSSNFPNFNTQNFYIEFMDALIQQ